jgi:hypothetical protein
MPAIVPCALLTAPSAAATRSDQPPIAKNRYRLKTLALTLERFSDGLFTGDLGKGEVP